MSIKLLLENGYIVVLDTNVLLNVYHYSPEFTDFALECLRAIINSIYLPSTVKLEYDLHRNMEFRSMEKRIADNMKGPQNSVIQARNALQSSLLQLERLQFQDVDDLRKTLSIQMDAVEKAVNDYFEGHEALNLIQQSWNGQDLLQDLIQRIDQFGHIMPSLTQREIYNWCDEGKRRYTKSIPPGFMDAKNKDGVRKYSDLLLWKEILRFAKDNKLNIIYVTDDMKRDWWETDNDNRFFHRKLVNEFDKTGQQFMAMTSQDFFAEVAASYSIRMSDAVEIALNMTDRDYCEKIQDEVFEIAEEELIYNAMNYIDFDSSHIGSEGIEEFEVSDYTLVKGERVERNNDTFIYYFTYEVTVEGTSYERTARDEDIRDTIQTGQIDHVFKGTIVVHVERNAELYYDFKNDHSFEYTEVVYCALEEVSYTERITMLGELGYCPGCGQPLNIHNDRGGYCVKCAPEH